MAINYRRKEMTIVIVVLIGIGALLFLSAIEGQSIMATFQQIMRGEQLKLSGKQPGA
jgi:hypothetical protein